MKQIKINKTEQKDISEVVFQFDSSKPTSNGVVYPLEAMKKAIEEYNERPNKLIFDCCTPTKTHRDGNNLEDAMAMIVGKLEIVETREDGTVTVMGNVKPVDNGRKELTNMALDSFPEFSIRPMMAAIHDPETNIRKVVNIFSFNIVRDPFFKG